MFCWGNTTNGELGLGGIEDQHILAPRELKLNEIIQVQYGNYFSSFNNKIFIVEFLGSFMIVLNSIIHYKILIIDLFLFIL